MYWPILYCLTDALTHGGEEYVPQDYISKCVLQAPTIKLSDVDKCKEVREFVTR